MKNPAMRQRFGRFAMAVVLLAAVAMGDARAQDGGILIADGLNGPMGILVTPVGAVWVVDSGTGGDDEVEAFDPVARRPTTVRVGETSRIIKVDPDGTQTVVHWLPSTMFNPTQIYGGAHLAMLDGELYATSGGWSGDNPTDRPPLASAVVRFAGEERAVVANTWDVEREHNPDGMLLATNPHGITAGPDGMLWVADAAGNTLLKVDPASGAVEVVAVFDGIESPLPNADRGGAMESDPVPTAVAFDDEGNTYVSLLSGIPFVPGAAKVVRVTPEGEVQEYATNLTMLTDLCRGPDGALYAVTYARFTEQGPVPNSGAVVRVREGGGSEEVVTGLSFPTAVGFNAAGDAFVTTNGGGPPGAGELRKFAAIAARK